MPDPHDCHAKCPICDEVRECHWQEKGIDGVDRLRCLTCGTLFSAPTYVYRLD